MIEKAGSLEILKGISLLSNDGQSCLEEYGVTISDRFMDKEAVSEVTKNIIDITVNTLVEKIDKGERVSIAVAPVGSVPLIFSIFDRLNELDPSKNYLESIDLIYCIPSGIYGNKTVELYKYNNESELAKIKDGDYVLNQHTIMVEDIFDSIETYAHVQKRIKTLVGIAPVVKGKDQNNKYKSTFENHRELYIEENSPYIKCIKEENILDLCKPGINFVEVVENRWIRSGFGMNGGTEDIERLGEDERAYVEALERFSGVLLYGSSDAPPKLEDYKRILSENSVVYINSDLFKRVVNIIKLNNRRKAEQLDPVAMINEINDLFLQANKK